MEARIDALCHYGKKGMKWHKHKIDNQKATIVKRGSKLTRISLNPNEPIDDNRKYVSTNNDDQKFWEQRLVNPYKNIGYKYVYKYQYKTIKDIKTSTVEENGKQLTKKILNDPSFLSKVEIGNAEYLMRSGMKQTDTTTDFFRSLGWRTQASQEYMKYMRDQGYDAISDIYGKTSGAKDPIILLDPKKSITLKNITTL